MNVLFTCAGRRNYLLSYFKDALGVNGKVYAADASPEAPALQEADHFFVVPQVKEEGYIDTILDICKKYKIALLFSLNDLELPLLAKAKQKFLDFDTIPVVSSAEVIDTCFDKWKMISFLNNIGVEVPKTHVTLKEAQEQFKDKECGPYYVIKPRWGTASIGIEYPEDKEELEWAYNLGKKRLQRTFLADISASDFEKSMLIQEKLDGEEYGLDIINDLQGNYVCTFVKKKLAMRAGETDRAVTKVDKSLEELGRVIGEKLGHIGLMDCDVFINERGTYVLELNPRFGGGYPFSHMAGANLPAAMLAWAKGESPKDEWLQVDEGVTSAKCDRMILIENKRRE